MLKQLRRMVHRPKREAVKTYWRTKWNSCENAAVIFQALSPQDHGRLANVLEFGTSWGGNLRYFMDRLPAVHTVGVDVNPLALEPAGEYPNYTGLVGDETTLARFADGAFDLAFTVSVLDHMPFDYVVDEVIGQLVRVARRVLLLEPWIAGVHGEVSCKTRDQVQPGLERGEKRFAQHSFVWDLDRLLRRRALAWRKVHTPLHAASLGPFYYLYDIQAPVSGRVGGRDDARR